jgi:hypothetical protein
MQRRVFLTIQDINRGVSTRLTACFIFKQRWHANQPQQSQKNTENFTATRRDSSSPRPPSRDRAHPGLPCPPHQAQNCTDTRWRGCVPRARTWAAARSRAAATSAAGPARARVRAGERSILVSGQTDGPCARTFAATARTAASSILPRRSGQYACTTTPRARHHATIGFCWQSGCTCTGSATTPSFFRPEKKGRKKEKKGAPRSGSLQATPAPRPRSPRDVRGRCGVDKDINA